MVYRQNEANKNYKTYTTSRKKSAENFPSFLPNNEDQRAIAQILKIPAVPTDKVGNPLLSLKRFLVPSEIMPSGKVGVVYTPRVIPCGRNGVAKVRLIFVLAKFKKLLFYTKNVKFIIFRQNFQKKIINYGKNFKNVLFWPNLSPIKNGGIFRTMFRSSFIRIWGSSLLAAFHCCTSTTKIRARCWQYIASKATRSSGARRVTKTPTSTHGHCFLRSIII